MSKFFQSLESRRMFSGVPLSVSQAIVNGVLELRVNGTSGADQIGVTRTVSGFQVTNTGGWTKTYNANYSSIRIDAAAGNDSVVFDPSIKCKTMIYGGEGCDTLIGGSGADRLFGGAGNDLLRGMAGNDVLVTVGGGKSDRSAGGAGIDSIWTDTGSTELVSDVSSTETLVGAVHRVGGFINGASRELGGENLADPAASGASGSANFSTRPLFSDAGPIANDVQQGNVGDCYFLATLSSIAQTNPTRIRQSVVELGDGTYAVQFKRNGGDVFVRVDGDLATFGDGSPAYAKLATQQSTWVAIIEKAFAYFRTGAATYDSITAGWMSEAYDALGVTNQTRIGGSNGIALLQQIKSDLSAGKAVTFAVNSAPEGSGLVSTHAYSVASVATDANGTITGLRLRNPWAVDGYNCTDGSNDGYVTVSPQVALAAMSAWTSAAV